MDLESIEEDFVAVDVQPEEPQADAQPTIPLRPSLITALSELLATFDEKYPVIPPAGDLHPFSPKPPDTDVLESILRVTPMITASLASVAQANIHPRFILRTKEYTNHADAWLKSQIKVGTLFRQLPKRKQNYAADLPLEPSLVPAWLLDEVMLLVKSLGMEMFREDGADGRIKFFGGGRILVVDIEFMLMSTPSSQGEVSTSPGIPRLQLVFIKTTHGSSESSANRAGDERSPLDTLLYSSLSSFLNEAQSASSDCLRLQKLAGAFEEHAKDLMTLDGLANAEASLGTGDRWFKETDEEGKIAVDLASREAQALAGSVGSSTAPLDILIHRGHGYPLPYLTSPFLTFLVGLPPRIYLSMLRAQSALPLKQSQQNSVDIPPSIIRDYIFNNQSSCTLATLKLSSTTDTPNSTNHLATLLPPAFSLLSDQTDFTALLSADPLTVSLPEPTHGIPQEHLDRLFPTVTELTPEPDPLLLSPPPVKGYVLDFGSEGIVMRREPMNRLSGGIDLGMDIDGGLGSMDGGFNNFGSPGWLDLLVNSKAISHSTRYVSQIKATGSNPAVQHLLSPPTDPGFVLGSIRVARMSDVWRVLEVVKEQAWLNETLRSFKWRVDSATTKDEEKATEVAKLLTDEEELEALIQGSQVPTSIPVQISVMGTTINYTVPLPLPDSPLVMLSVAFDPRSPKGVRVDFDPATTFLQDQTNSIEKISQVVHEWKDGMEEVVRRGGASILAGWVWRKVQERFPGDMKL